MKRLSTEKRALAINLMVEGMSMRAIARTLKVSLNTVYKLHADAGAAAVAYHRKVARNLDVSLVQCDEIWSFIYAKKRNVPTALKAPPEAGDAWTWTALDVDSRFMLNWEVGDRTTRTAQRFMNNLKRRLGGNRIQLTTDGHPPYLKAVPRAFGYDIDFATLVKMFGTDDPVIDPRVVLGNPDPDLINTSYIERSNLTLRSEIRRFTRRTNGHSKSIEALRCSVALYFLYYNFCRPHLSLKNGTQGKVTPAMAIGLTDRVYDIEWIVGLIDARAPKPNRPKTYKKSEAMARKQRTQRIKRAREGLRKAH